MFLDFLLLGQTPIPRISSRQPKPPEKLKTLETMQIDEHQVPYTLRRSRKTRYVKMQVGYGDGLEVVAPMRTSHGEITRILSQKADWIKKTLTSYGQFPHPTERMLQPGATISYLGEDCTVLISTGIGPRVKIELAQPGKFTITLPLVDSKQQIQLARVALKKWYSERAREIITQRATQLAGEMNVVFQSISIKSQKTRWGSCSRQGNLNFNWKLAMAPREVIDYLVVHELSHLRHLNHSKNFWQLVEKHCPDYKQRDKWLKANGPKLGF